MKILAIDLGKKFGWCYLDKAGVHSNEGHYTDIVEWGRVFKELLDLWKPTIVVLSQTNNNTYQTQ